MSQSFRIGRRTVGEGHRCFVIAEAGSNHNGNLAQALGLIAAAVAAGADAVKFQVFRARTMYPRAAGVSVYLGDSRSIYDIIAEMEMPYEWLPLLAERCQETGIEFLATPFDEISADLLEAYVPAFKIASYELTHVPLLKHVAGKKKPVILSTGTAALAEVADAVRILRDEHVPFVLMQCTAAYPAPLESLNVSAIRTLKEAFGCPAGLSDHSRDPVIGPVLAVGYGANVVEKHFTFSNAMPGPDHRFAIEPDELSRMVTAVRSAEAARGTGEKQMLDVERELRMFARRSIFATRHIEPGQTLTPDNIAVLRCGQLPAGFEPKEWPNLLGRQAKSHIPEGAAITAARLA